jgi:hypothetical protein
LDNAVEKKEEKEKERRNMRRKRRRNKRRKETGRKRKRVNRGIGVKAKYGWRRKRGDSRCVCLDQAPPLLPP